MMLWLTQIGLRLYMAMTALLLVAVCVQGVNGLGVAVFSAPFAAVNFPTLAPGPLLAMGCPLALLALLAVLALRREFHAIDWPAAKTALVRDAGGTSLAAADVSLAAPRTLALSFGILILAGVIS